MSLVNMNNNDDNKPTTTIIKLSALDQIMPRAYTPFPLTFTIRYQTRSQTQTGDDGDDDEKNKKDNNVNLALEILSRAFDQLVSEIEVLRGCVVPASRRGELEVQIAAAAAAATAAAHVGHRSPHLVVRDFSEGEENEDENEKGNGGAFDLKYLPVVRGGGTSASDADVEASPVFAAQANIVKGNRIILCICLHHSVMDGMGMAAVIRRWAERCHAISAGMSAAPLDEACVDKGPVITGGRHHANMHHPSYSIGHAAVPKHVQEQRSKLSGTSRMVGRCFQLNKEKAANTKAAFDQVFKSQNRDGAWVSINDILCTILWHSITRARLAEGLVSEGNQSKLGVPVNVRSKMVPPLPRNYIGNATVDATAERSITALATWTIPELAHTALSIRQAISAVDDTYIRALIDVIDGLEDAGSIKTSRADFLGDDVTITSWLDMGLCEMDWGETLGKIEEKTPKFDGFDGLCIVLPRRRDGSVKIMVGLEEKTMNRLEKDEEFKKYVKVV